MSEAVEYCKSIAEQLEEAEDLGEFINERELDIDYILNGTKDFVNCRIYFTVQGPTVWVDTEECCVKYRHMSQEGFWGLSSGMASRINDIIYERDFAD